MTVEDKAHTGDGNRQYKDSLFCFLFGKEERKEYTLALYNMFNETDYTDLDDLKIMTLDNVLFINYRNDVACMIDPNVINLWEEQSSWNPNMGLRFFMYLSAEWSKYLYMTRQDPSHNSLCTVPWPNCIVLFNGPDDWPAEKEMSILDNLSKTMPKKYTNVDLKYWVYNVNVKTMHVLFGKCRPLYEYSWMISKVQEYTREHMYEKKNENLTYAIQRMIDEIPEEFEVYELMHAQRQEVVSMIFTEFDARRHDNIVYEDGLAQGMIRGRSEGLEEGLAKGMTKGIAEGMTKGKEEGLTAMIHTLKLFISDPDEMYRAVTANPGYANVTYEAVKKMYEADRKNLQ